MKETFTRQGDLTLKIGDALYFSDPNLRKRPDLTYSQSFTDVFITASFYQPDDVPMVDIYITKEQKDEPDLFYTVEDESVNSRLGDMEAQELGCDTASYLINGDTVHTGADGNYGYVVKAQEDVLVMLNAGWNYTEMREFKATVLNALGMNEHAVN